MNRVSKPVPLAASVALALAGGVGNASVPNYRVETISPIGVATSLYAASEAGHVAGYQVVNGLVKPFIARPGQGHVMLPLPAGYSTGAALDVNSRGWVVGTVSTTNFPFDLGAPAVWVPQAGGGYTVSIPQQFSTLPNPLRPGTVISVQGGQAVGINEQGTIVGWSRYFGFSGGPATLFSVDQPPVNLRELGFDATVRDINNNDVICGDGKRFDIGSSLTTDLGLPPPPPQDIPISAVIAYAINDSNEVVAAARRSTSLPDKWVTYLHDGAATWTRLNPDALPSPFVSFYDNNNRGDVSAGGGVLFMDEGVLVPSFDSLLEPGSTNWSTALGFINDDRRVFTTAVDAITGDSFIVVLTPVDFCAADLDRNGVLTGADFFEFLALFEDGSLRADLSGPAQAGVADGELSGADFFEFLGMFAAGCP